MELILIVVTLVKILVVIGIMLGLVSYTVMAERRVSAAIQDRIGPNRTGIPLGGISFFGIKIPEFHLWGLGQPIADAVKFLLKEEFTPGHVRTLYFWLAPALAMAPALLTVCVIPFASLETVNLAWFDLTIPKPGVIADVNVGVLFIFAITSLAVYGIVIAGWASNSKYSFLGGIRSSAQMISYEIAMGLSVIPLFLVVGNLNLSEIINYQIREGWLVFPLVNLLRGELPDWHSLLLWPCLGFSFIIFLIAAFAETNRLPFDLPESETELVGGYHTEYSAMKFALFFLGEYAAMIVVSGLMVTLFLGGWSLPFNFFLDWQGQWWAIPLQAGVFVGKMAMFLFFFIWVRWTLPRFRYDQLMTIGWMYLLPLALANILVAAFLIALFPR